jgi:hypothetical protein
LQNWHACYPEIKDGFPDAFDFRRISVYDNPTRLRMLARRANQSEFCQGAYYHLRGD